MQEKVTHARQTEIDHLNYYLPFNIAYFFLPPNYKHYRNYLKERTDLNERPFRKSPLFPTEKFNKHPGLNKCFPSNQEKGAHLEILNVCRSAHSDSL